MSLVTWSQIGHWRWRAIYPNSKAWRKQYSSFRARQKAVLSCVPDLGWYGVFRLLSIIRRPGLAPPCYNWAVRRGWQSRWSNAIDLRCGGTHAPYRTRNVLAKLRDTLPEVPDSFSNSGPSTSLWFATFEIGGPGIDLKYGTI